jgi:SlyX protein
VRVNDDARLIEIETRLAFQESALQDLGDLVNRQRLELESLRRALVEATADLLTLREGMSSGAANEPPPPHY